MVASAPTAAARAAADAASAMDAPAACAWWYARTAGASASTIVLSPSAAAPSPCTPSRAAARAVPSASGLTSGAAPSALPARRKAVPYKGPDAPPTLEIRVVPTSTRTSPGVPVVVSCSAAVTAVKPRTMLTPWSASPIAESSCVSRSLLISSSVAIRPTQSRTVVASTCSTFSMAVSSPAPPQRRRLHGSVPELGQVRREAHDRDRDAGHVQGGDVVPDERAGDLRAEPVDDAGDLVEDEIQLDQRRATHPVDEHCEVARERHVAVDRVEGEVDDLRRRPVLAALAAGLAVDADSQLDLVVGQLEAGLPGAWRRTCCECDTEGPAALVDLVRDVSDLLELLV